MNYEKTFSFSFLSIVKKNCIEFDITIEKVENVPGNKIKIFFYSDDMQMRAFIFQINSEYKGFINYNPEGKNNVLFTS